MAVSTIRMDEGHIKLDLRYANEELLSGFIRWNDQMYCLGLTLNIGASEKPFWQLPYDAYAYMQRIPFLAAMIEKKNSGPVSVGYIEYDKHSNIIAVDSVKVRTSCGLFYIDMENAKIASTSIDMKHIGEKNILFRNGKYFTVFDVADSYFVRTKDEFNKSVQNTKALVEIRDAYAAFDKNNSTEARDLLIKKLFRFK